MVCYVQVNIADENNQNTNVESIVSFVRNGSFGTVNVAGSRESTDAGVYAVAKTLLSLVFEKLINKQ